MMSRSFLLAIGLFGLPLVVVVGCGDDGLEARYPVSGAVVYKGKPVEKGLISFVPDGEQGRGASGEIKEGAYNLTTNAPGDGAFPGKYKVIVSAKDMDEAKAKAEVSIRKLAAKAKVQVDTSGGIPDPAMLGKALRTARNAVPKKYESSATSDLRAEVKAENNTCDFELKD